MIINDKFDNLVSLYQNGVKSFANNPLFGVKNQTTGEYEWVTYGAVGKRIDNFRAGLASVGIKKGDAVGGIFNNSIEYAVCCFGTYGLVSRWIPMYLKERHQVWQYIINDAEIKALVVDNDEVYDVIMGFKDKCPKLEHIYIIKTQKENSLAALEKKGAENPVEAQIPSKKDIACLIYTSGTTGEPKGVLLSHNNLATNAQAGNNMFPNDLNENSRSFAILPWAHSFGLTAELNNWFQSGGSIGLMDTMDTLIEDLPKVAPNILVAVPRVFNKIYDGVHKKMKVAGGIKYKLFLKALELAKIKRETGKAGFMYKLLHKLVIEKVRHAFGGKLYIAVTGSAVMNVEVAKFFIDIGVNCYDAYGLTETSPAATMNSPEGDGWRLGSIGRAVEKVTIKIDKERVGEDSEDGEIIVYGPNVMQGYHNKPEETAKVMTPDGGLRTGDRGRMDKDGFVFITGRFKEEYKLENGKYVHPASIEEDIKMLPYIANAFVYGDGKKYNVSLIVPEEANIDILGVSTIDELLASKEAHAKLEKGIQDHLQPIYGGYEIPRKFKVITEDFALENGMLTQTMKLKRANIMKEYSSDLDSLY